jgi:3-deoxy-D-manno-octulosonic acid kinase
MTCKARWSRFSIATPTTRIGPLGAREFAVRAPAGFEWVEERRARFLVRADVRSWLVGVLREANGDPVAGARLLHSGRGGTRVIAVAGHEIVMRPYRRGGLPARLLRDVYFGWRLRPFEELRTTEALRRRGAPVVEVYGAAVRWLASGCYRGWIATRYIPGAHTLWEWACTAPASIERNAILQGVGTALRRLHACGARHPDLNANNILICPSGDASGTPAVVFIDFDRPRIAPRGANAQADLARLQRSVRNLDPHHRTLTRADLERILTSYREPQPHHDAGE